MIKYRFLATVVLMASAVVFTSCSDNKVETADNYEVVEFPDGSMAYLNHNSSVSYNENFDPRSVDMEGEVFFSVVHDDSPFVVHANQSDIKVLGTEFNVKSDDEELEVEVSEGVVELDAKGEKNKVNVGERIAFLKKEGKIEKGKAELQFKLWMRSLEIEFKKMGKDIKHGTKEIGKETKKVGKDIKKELKKLKN